MRRAFIVGPMLAVLSLSACATAEDKAPTAASDKPSAKATKKQPDSRTQEPDEATPNVCKEKSTGQKCAFDQIAEFTARAGWDPEKKVEITVAKPTPFTPVAGSSFDGPKRAQNVVFTITIKNLSKGTAWSDPVILPYLESGGKDGSQIYVGDYCCGGEKSGMLWPDKIRPGETVTVRDEWSVEDLSDIAYELKIEGQAGHSITFAN